LFKNEYTDNILSIYYIQSMEETIHCNTCNLDFKNNPTYKKHLNTNRHIERSTNSNIVIFTCICGKSYSYSQSLRLHQRTCELYQNSDEKPNPSINMIISSRIVQQLRIENNDLREKQKSFHNELDELRAQIALLQDKEIQPHEMKAKPAVHVEQDRDTDRVHQQNIKRRDKRKKINKDTRKRIVDNQENTCGECKLVLSPYFELDHVIGLQFGGTDDESNLMALCRECHAIKSIKENQRRKLIKDAIQTILNVDITL
jgi:5-methylcytosine-specific restriction endonuclease McrA